MINVVNRSNDCHFNLSVEEYFVKHKKVKEDIVIIWQNSPTIVVGKNQNTYEELNMEYIEDNNIKVVRRMSGGGAVYHDLGNINFTVIKKNGSLYKNDFSFFSNPVLNCLKEFGVEANFTGRNDIEIEGQKFSGNAQYFYKDIVLHHGTLLFSSDLEILSKALKVKKEKFESKGIKSVKSRVTNISNHFKGEVSPLLFKEVLIENMFKEYDQKIKNYELSKEDLEAIGKLKDEKYGTWEWNFGKSPKMNYRRENKFSSGFVLLCMNVEKGTIKDIKLQGDFFEVKPIEELEELLKNRKYDIKSILDGVDTSKYIHKMTNEEFQKLFV